MPAYVLAEEEVIEVKSKVLVAVLALAVVLLATPMLGTVMAGKGQEKLDFLLHMEGTTVAGSAEKAWTTNGETRHIYGLVWEVREGFYIEIGEAGAVEIIPKECLSYFGLMDIMQNLKQGFNVLTVKETITVYTDDTKTTERGTIEILTQGMNPGGNGLMVNGHGTGEFEGIKITGRTATVSMPNPSPPPANLLSIDRVGTVMGWPT